ncbi:MAG: WD40 repeat domain-containing protein [Catenulispora sp.]|nr:WD40 repeat domain-containing protein [Catenulispora sp.]
MHNANDLEALRDAEFQRQDQARETAFRDTMLVRAMAYPGDDAKAGWWFTGRNAALEGIAEWLRDTDPVCVVTGDPGSGKSAILGLVAAVTHTKRRASVPMTTLGVDPERFPVEAVDATVYAQHMTDAEMVEAIAAVARVTASSASDLLAALDGRAKPLTVIIDGVDEAATPESLCRDVLRHLAQHSQGRIRLLLGMRPYLVEHLRLGALGIGTLGIDLDGSQFADPTGLRSYAVRILAKSVTLSPYRDGREGSGRRVAVAEAVAEAAGDSFLVARIVAGTLAAAEHAVADPYDPEWRRSLPRNADKAMVEDLDRRLGTDAQRAIDLLRPLAFAQGEGLPWENLWPALASAMSGREYGDDDVLWLLEEAGSYVVEAVQSGRSAYRLYHQALAEHLMGGFDARVAHAAFMDVFVDAVPLRADDGCRDWSRAHPYALQHLAWHAVQAGRLDDVLEESEYLVHVPPRALTPHLRHAVSEAARGIASVYRCYLETHSHLEPSERRQILALAASEQGIDQIRENLISRIPSGEWSVHRTSGNGPLSSAVRDVMVDESGIIMAVACTTIDGVPILVTAGSRLILWDLRSGLRYGDPIEPDIHVGTIDCVIQTDGTIAVVRSPDWVRAWNLRTRQQVEPPVGIPNSTVLDRSIKPVVVEVAGQPTLVTVDALEWLTAWDLQTGECRGAVALPVSPILVAVDAAEVDGILIAVTVHLESFRSIVRTWDIRPTTAFDAVRDPRSYQVATPTFVEVDQSMSALVSSSSGIERHDMETGERWTLPLETTGIPAITVLPRDDGHPIAVISDGRVRTWDLRSNWPLEQLSPRVPPRIQALAGVSVGTDFFVAAVLDKILLRLHPEPLDRMEIEHDYTGSAVACINIDGEPIALAIGLISGLWIWNIRTGDLQASLASQHEALACTYVNGSPTAVLAGSGSVEVLDLKIGSTRSLPVDEGSGFIRTLTCAHVDDVSMAALTRTDGVTILDLTNHRVVDFIALPNPVNAALSSKGDLAVAFLHGLALFRRRP